MADLTPLQAQLYLGTAWALGAVIFGLLAFITTRLEYDGADTTMVRLGPGDRHIRPAGLYNHQVER